MGRRSGILGLLGFSLLLSITLGILLIALFENIWHIPDTVNSLFGELLIAIALSSIITVMVYTHWLRGRVDWIYY